MRMGLGMGMGMGNRPSRSSSEKDLTKYLFIDGNCLRVNFRAFVERYAPGTDLSLDWTRLSGGYKKAFYYDAIPVREEQEAEDSYQSRIANIVELHRHLSTIDGFRVYEGDARKRSGRGLEQKKVDIMIAVDMLTHTIRGNMQEAGLLAGDLDFKPLLDALVNEGMFVSLIYPPRFINSELLAAADSRIPMSPSFWHFRLTEESRNLLGRWPTKTQSGGLDKRNLIEIQKLESTVPELTIWHDPVNASASISWRLDNLDTYLRIYNASWERLRLFAKDEHSIDLPKTLPREFADL